jgi:hypothetical protein
MNLTAENMELLARAKFSKGYNWCSIEQQIEIRAELKKPDTVIPLGKYNVEEERWWNK